MKIFLRVIRISFCLVLFLFLAVTAVADPEGLSPVNPPFVREGDFAVKLALALGVAATEEEEAEDRLNRLGISPRSGWIADHPVTPDIAGELRVATGAAADSGRLPLSREEALKRFDYLNYSLGLPGISGGLEGEKPAGSSIDSTAYPDSAALDEYYRSAGPPLITYRLPPPGFIGLYAWVPYTFRYCGSSFSGYYIRRDVHKVTFARKGAVRIPHRSDGRVRRIFRSERVHGYAHPPPGKANAPEIRTFGSPPTHVPRAGGGGRKEEISKDHASRQDPQRGKVISKQGNRREEPARRAERPRVNAGSSEGALSPSRGNTDSFPGRSGSFRRQSRDSGREHHLKPPPPPSATGRSAVTDKAPPAPPRAANAADPGRRRAGHTPWKGQKTRPGPG